MPDAPGVSFGPYQLAGPHGPLWCQGQVVAVPPKALAVLWALVRQAGQVVPKGALLEAGWPETAVSDGVLTSCLGILRQALGEDARQPRYIATVHRVGYRFVAPVTPLAPTTPPGPPPVSPPPPLWRDCVGAGPEGPFPATVSAEGRLIKGGPSPSPPPLLVGRTAEVAALHTCLTTALAGTRQLVFVTGEAGVGKTSVVEAFLAEVAVSVWVGRGQCVEHYGAGEAYLPLLDALSRLGRASGGAPLVACLRQYAPTWLAQLPARLSAADAEAVQRTVAGATRERMLRELAEALEVLTDAQPLILVLEDLHWSDASTVEALALLARRREAARLLILGTYRPVELIVHQHPLRPMKQELAAHGQCVDLPLGYLPREAVAAYVVQHPSPPAQSAAVAAWVYRRTAGHPLFMVQMLDYLRQHDLLEAAAHAAGPPALEQAIPQGLQQLLEAQLERLEARAQEVLEVASVAGTTFAVASVAAGVARAPEVVEEVCAELVRQGQFLEDLGLVEWPDGTVSGQYGFRHALYQEVVYKRLGLGQRARWHRLLGLRHEAGYGARASEWAAELAMHFERGGDYARAVRYRQQAAENALRRWAYREAIAHCTTGLALLATLPETAARTQQELDLHIVLGPALIATKGFAAPEVEQTYARARALCEKVGDTPQLLWTLRGLCAFYRNQGTLQTAQELGEQLMRLAQREADPMYLLEGHDTLGDTLFAQGEYAAAWTHLEQGIALIDSTAYGALALHHGPVPGARCLGHAALTLWCLGYPTQALRRSQEALALAQAVSHPLSLADTQFNVARLHHYRREVLAVQAQTEALLSLVASQEFQVYVEWGTMLHGWALAMQGQGAAGLAQLRQGLAAVLAAGQPRPYFVLLLAEAVGHVGQVEEGLRLVAEALTVIEEIGQGRLLAEAYRLQGALLLCQAAPDARQAEACFQHALARARHQQAKSDELRAATSLSRLWQHQGKQAAARELLAPIYGWFTEGFDTADLQDARALLEELGT